VQIEADSIPAAADGPVTRVIVIGAGVSGLVAARALQLAGIDVAVVEGRDRIGGRTHTVDLGGASVDLGASWIHPGLDSKMIPLVQELGIEPMPASSGSLVTGAATFPNPADRDAMLAAMARLIMSAMAPDAVPAETDLDSAMEQLLPDVDANVRGTVGALIAINEGKDAREVRFATFASAFTGDAAAPHEDVMPRGGYRGLVDHLASDLAVHLGCTVASVEQTPDGVRVVTSAGDFAGSHALVTVPLGVLKAGAIRFDPPLPAAHCDAIARVGFGTLEKVALAYPRPVLPSHITLVDSPHPDWLMLLDFSAWYGVPVVVALAPGEHGRALAEMDEDKRVASLHELVCRVAGPDTPDPIAFATTSWATDPFLLGCYANYGPGATAEQHAADVTALGQPHGRVLFAGEHTCEIGTSTVDSAWHTGVREAARLLQRTELSL
jgi:monoamine oxidase